MQSRKEKLPRVNKAHIVTLLGGLGEFVLRLSLCCCLGRCGMLIVLTYGQSSTGRALNHNCLDILIYMALPVQRRLGYDMLIEVADYLLGHSDWTRAWISPKRLQFVAGALEPHSSVTSLARHLHGSISGKNTSPPPPTFSSTSLIISTLGYWA
jgi:hypothetical protein